MEILRDLSLFYSMLHVSVIFLMLFRSRYAERKTILLGAAGLGTLMILNSIGLVLLGVEIMGKLLLLTCTVPSFLYFFFISKDRSGAFLFTFCLVDTVCYWVLCVTNLLEHFFGGGQFVVMLVTRVVAYPVMEFIIYKYLRKFYMELQVIVKKGWIPYAGMTALYYVLLVGMAEFPSRINARPEYIPVFILVLVLMVFNYVIIFSSLYRQYKLYESEKVESLLQEQKQSLENQLENQQHIRKIRHDMRGHTITLQGLLRSGKQKEALEYLDSMERSIDAAQTTVCADPYLNAQLSHYLHRFRQMDTQLVCDLQIGSGALPAAHRICSILSNGLQNALEELAALPKEEREVSLQMKYSRDYLIIRLRNRCRDGLTVERGSVPKTRKSEKGHGYGLQSIQETAEAMGGDMICYTENHCFVLDVMLRTDNGGKQV